VTMPPLPERRSDGQRGAVGWCTFVCVLLRVLLRSSRETTLFLVSACSARDRHTLRVDDNNLVGTIPSDVIALSSLEYVRLCPCECDVVTAVAALPLSTAPASCGAASRETRSFCDGCADAAVVCCRGCGCGAATVDGVSVMWRCKSRDPLAELLRWLR
jgi:hypothetical protein